MTDAASICFTYPGLPPKEFSRNSREHWSVLNRVQDQVANDVAVLLLEAGWKPTIPPEHSEVAVEFVLPDHRRRDSTNLITSYKPIEDALVTHGVIKDDSIAVIGWTKFSDRYEKGVSATEITIKELLEDE